MFNDDVFQREKRAYEIVKKSVDEMLANGYSPHLFDNVPSLQMDIVFVGPGADEKGNRDVKKLTMPYQYISLLLAEEPALNEKFSILLNNVREASGNLNNFIMALISRKLEDKKYGGNSGDQEYQN